MRSKSDQVGGVQVFAVCGTNTVSFGIRADAGARDGLLGFGVTRGQGNPAEEHGTPRWMYGYKVFEALVANPTPKTWVSTEDHPIQSLVWDDFTCEAGRTYTYEFHPYKGAPGALDRSAPVVSIQVTTEPLYGDPLQPGHDVFFNRGVISSQAYAREFGNKSPDDQPTKDRTDAALAWLTRDLEPALIRFIQSAGADDQLHGCFYEFQYAPVLDELNAAVTRGVELRLVVDEKCNETCGEVTSGGNKTHVLRPSDPRFANLSAMCAMRFPHQSVIPREARRDTICHNKFLVLTPKATGRPSQVWTGSTNVTASGIYGQANVGHWVRNETVAQAFMDYWTLLSTDPGARTSATKDPANVAYRKAITTLSPAPPSAGVVLAGTTPVFSPQADDSALKLYVELLGGAEHLSCATFAFGIGAPFKARLAQNSSATGPLCFLLLESEDKPNSRSATPFVRLDSDNNVYEAYGSELTTPLGQWMLETDSRKVDLTHYVAFIHLKVLLRDPLGADPVVVTGSANFSEASTTDNDENMLIIKGDRRVADIYFTEFNRLFGHYYFRSVVDRIKQSGQPDPDAGQQFLRPDASWLDGYRPGSLRTKRAALYTGMQI